MRVQGVQPPIALASVFESEVRSIFGFLLTRCGSRALAEDLTGETFAAASKCFAEGRGAEVTPRWLRTVARRRLIDHWRAESRHRRRIEHFAQVRVVEEAPESDPDGRVDDALAALSSRQRAALSLRYLDGFSTAEVADVFGMSYRAAESLLARARSSFGKAYEEVVR